MADRSRQLYALYATRFANSFGFITLLTLLPTNINLFDPSGVEIGLFTTALTLTQAVTVIPIAYPGDRYDKRLVLLGSLGVGAVAYAGFGFVTSSGGFILARGLQGLALTDLAVNRRILTITSFRGQYAVAVTLVRTWVPIYAGVEAASGGLAYGAVAVLVPFTPQVGATLGLPATLPLLGPLSPAFLPLVALNALLGVFDSLREPASMALFADEGTDNGGVASSFGIRSIVWRPGSIVAPMIGGFLMTTGMASVFQIGALAAFGGVGAFALILLSTHGRDGLSEW